MSLPKMISVRGLEFGRLTALGNPFAKGSGKNAQGYHVCQCSCGNTCEVRTSELLKGNQESCGCGINGKTAFYYKGCGDLTGTKYNRIKKLAERRKIEFAVSIEYLAGLFDAQKRTCSLSGLPLTLPLSAVALKEFESTASLDRIDSSKGYIVGNVQWVHKHVNMMKQSLSEDQFIILCKLIAKKHE